MRAKIIAGNWKMYKTLPETADLVNGLKSGLPPSGASPTVVICPPFTSLALAGELLKGSPLHLGAQNMSEHDEGAYTGEISWKMLRSAGCEYVILGHSERRLYFHETDDLINRKARKALLNGLRPILCVGETLEERENGSTARIVARQVNGVLAGLSAGDMKSVVIAYEPVWAIGTGRNATPKQAQEVHSAIRTLVRDLFSSGVSDLLPIQYGGSVRPENAGELLSQPDIDGALVGGACLKVDSFTAIVNAA
jgi:triosephosphate isomerase (TIM)